MRKAHLVLLILLLVGCTPATPVTIHALATNPQTYDGQRVEVSGIITELVDSSIGMKSCPTGETNEQGLPIYDTEFTIVYQYRLSNYETSSIIIEEEVGCSTFNLSDYDVGDEVTVKGRWDGTKLVLS